MSDIIIDPSLELNGVIKAPPSKAYTHRSLVAAALSDGRSQILEPLTSDDSEATLGAVQAYGALVERSENVWTITGRSMLLAPKDIVDCGESGTTIRFMTPVADPSSRNFNPNRKASASEEARGSPTSSHERIRGNLLYVSRRRVPSGHSIRWKNSWKKSIVARRHQFAVCIGFAVWSAKGRK